MWTCYKHASLFKYPNSNHHSTYTFPNHLHILKIESPTLHFWWTSNNDAINTCTEFTSALSTFCPSMTIDVHQCPLFLLEKLPYNSPTYTTSRWLRFKTCSSNWIIFLSCRRWTSKIFANQATRLCQKIFLPHRWWMLNSREPPEINI